MATPDAGWSTSQCDNDISLGLVGLPSTQESIQATNELQFHLDPTFDLNTGLDTDLDAQIDAFCAKAGLPTSQSFSNLDIRPVLPLVNPSFEPAELPQACISNELFSRTYTETGLNPVPVQQICAYGEPQDYYAAYETPYFENYPVHLASTEDSVKVKGLTAIPGNSSLTYYENTQLPVRSYAYPTEPWSLPVEFTTLPTMHTGYVPVEASSHNDMMTRSITHTVEQEQAVTAMEAVCANVAPLSYANNRVIALSKESTRQGPRESDSGSDDDYGNLRTKTKMHSKRIAQKQLSNTFVNSTSTSAITPSEPVKYLPGEKPKKVDAKPWIRTNANTEGDTRTAKINNWKNKYEYKPLPLGTWSSGNYTFKYTKYENVDFLTEAPMSTRRIKEYIMKYPQDKGNRLIIWIQKVPADQGRRYGSKQHSKCVFRECPIQRYVEGTINTGEYRVAFDEKYNTYKDNVDPYDCAAYAHLYCMEQFLDFEQVCQVAEVRIDTRLDMPLEPNGKAAFSMVDVPARYEIEHFVRAASYGKLRQTPRWHNYPYHANYSREQQKPHERTLTYLAHCMYEAHQDDSHKKQAALRRVTVSQRRVHLGDLEMSVADKRIMIEVFGGKKRGQKGKVEDYYDERIRFHIDRAREEAEDFLKKKNKEHNLVNKGNKRKRVRHEETDDEEYLREASNDNEQHGSAHRLGKARACRNKKHRSHRADSPVWLQQPREDFMYVQPHQLQSPRQQLETYRETSFTHSPTPAQDQTLIDPALDTPCSLYAIPATPELDISDFSKSSNSSLQEVDLPDHNLEKLLALERRQSCTIDVGSMSTLEGSQRTTARRAVFESQPVSESKEYYINHPPSLVFTRRSERIATKDTVVKR